MRPVAVRYWIRLNPLLPGQFNIARKRVQMPHPTRHDYFQTPIPHACRAFDKRFRDRVLIDIAHLHIPSVFFRGRLAASPSVTRLDRRAR
jgi:hypothetical protein